MEIDGHPTQDMIEELEQRGAVRMHGSSAGPRVDTLRFLNEQNPHEVPGIWLFLPAETFQTGMDELPV
ncbi:MAG TPA: hypothetical protein VJ927_02205 [Actinomycetota bacterium]|nr:hypothetical protein [Actinomycetota bacterium]